MEFALQVMLSVVRLLVDIIHVGFPHPDIAKYLNCNCMISIKNILFTHFQSHQIIPPNFNFYLRFLPM